MSNVINTNEAGVTSAWDSVNENISSAMETARDVAGEAGESPSTAFTPNMNETANAAMDWAAVTQSDVTDGVKNAQNALDSKKKQATTSFADMTKKANKTVDDAKNSVDDAKKSATKAVDDAKNSVDDAKKSATKAADDAKNSVDAKKKDAMRAVDDVKKTVDAKKKDATKAVDDVKKTVDDAKKDAMKAVDDVKKTVDDAKKDAMKAVDDVQKTVDDTKKDAMKAVDDTKKAIDDTKKVIEEQKEEAMAVVNDALEVAEEQKKVVMGVVSSARQQLSSVWSSMPNAPDVDRVSVFNAIGASIAVAGLGLYVYRRFGALNDGSDENTLQFLTKWFSRSSTSTDKLDGVDVKEGGMFSSWFSSTPEPTPTPTPEPESILNSMPKQAEEIGAWISSATHDVSEVVESAAETVMEAPNSLKDWFKQQSEAIDVGSIDAGELVESAQKIIEDSGVSEAVSALEQGAHNIIDGNGVGEAVSAIQNELSESVSGAVEQLHLQQEGFKRYFDALFGKKPEARD